MRKLLLITGDIAAGKTTFSNLLATRYGCAVFQKDSVKEVLGDTIGYANRAENKRLSNASVSLMAHIFERIAPTGALLILEANFTGEEQAHLYAMAVDRHYEVLTLLLRGDALVLHQRYLRRMEENRHSVHLSTNLHEEEAFLRHMQAMEQETYVGATLPIQSTSFAYQTDETLLQKIDAFMRR